MSTCCFVGHRNIEITDALKQRIRTTVTGLIGNGTDIFYFGSRSQFNDLCYEAVTALKKIFTNIQRVYVRVEYPYIDSKYNDYLLQFYEDTFYPSQLKKSGKLAYVERNRLMIDASDFCVFYYNPYYTPPIKKSKYGLARREVQSGTKLAYDYAVYKNKELINLEVL